MAVGDVYQLLIMGRLHGQQTINVLHYKCQITGTADDAEAIINSWRSNTEAQYLNCCSEEFQMEGYVCQKIFPLPVQSAFTLETAFLPGTGGANSLPSSVSTVLTKRTNLGGRKGRGRIYMPAVPTTFEDNSVINDGARGTYALLCAKLNDPLALAIAGSYSPVLWHRATKTTDVIVDVIPRTTLRNQRRRQVGRGI